MRPHLPIAAGLAALVLLTTSACSNDSSENPSSETTEALANWKHAADSHFGIEANGSRSAAGIGTGGGSFDTRDSDEAVVFICNGGPKLSVTITMASVARKRTLWCGVPGTVKLSTPGQRVDVSITSSPRGKASTSTYNDTFWYVGMLAK